MTKLEIILVCILFAGIVLYLLRKRRKRIAPIEPAPKIGQSAQPALDIPDGTNTRPGGDASSSSLVSKFGNLPSQAGAANADKLAPGKIFPLGATFDGRGVNFALFSLHAQAVTLCLFDPDGQREVVRLPLMAGLTGVWHGYLSGARPGLIYGYRVTGPYEPQHGHRFNPAKLVLDPYARAVVGEFHDGPVHYGYQFHSPHQRDDQDNATEALKARVIDEPFDWEGDVAPGVPWSQTVIYEAHVKGLTRLHPQIPPALRGTYAGVAHPAIIAHLQLLGVTTLELDVQVFNLTLSVEVSE